jgi:GT2 family glycosyltransferase
MKKDIAVIVITFNRLEFLKEIIHSLRNQSLKPDKIFVVHNSGTDGTAEWLAEQNDLFVITQGNVGSSGGQYTGFKAAFEEGYEWIWTLDDDVVPAKDCLENLAKAAPDALVKTPLRYAPSGKVFYNDCIHFNLTNPFKSLWVRIIDDNDLKQDEIEADGITFEGPIIHRSIVEKIGYPEKKFFIYGDDSEYFIRAKKAGAKIKIIKKAVFNRKLDYLAPEDQFTWKHKYIIQNMIAIDRLHGNFAVKYLRPFAYLLVWIKRARNISELKTVIQGFFSGYFYKSIN